ncbi:MAG: hypothetical protein Q4P13_05290 [Psychrobacter sp.]|nr:hypothetical protein [Psychrobacter sp.]
MKRIQKHTFEAVSLLTADNGLLDITIVPAVGQPDWLIPSNLILEVVTYSDRIWTYLWQQQEIAMFHLIPREQTPNTLIILEGNTDVHRVGLQTAGELTRLQVRISDVKDIALPSQYLDGSSAHDVNDNDSIEAPVQSFNQDASVNEIEVEFDVNFNESRIDSYLFQCVQIKDKVYLVPDLDKIAHHLVDLDS